MSASTVARLKEKWHAEMAEWHQRPLDALEVVYLWVDGMYVKAGLEREKAAILVVLAALSDGRKVVVTAVPGHRESTESWSEVLRDLKRRGMECPRLVVGDGHLVIWGALRNVYPEAAEQRCWNHKILNVLNKLPKREHAQAKAVVCRIPYADTRQQAEQLKSRFLTWCRERSHRAAAEALARDWERMVTFYQFSQGTLATLAYNKPRGITLRRFAPQDRCRQTIQEDRPSHRGYLEDVHVGREALPAAQGSGTDERSFPRGPVHGRVKAASAIEQVAA